MRVVFDKLNGHAPFITSFKAEPESSRFWYGPGILRYMRLLQDSLDHGGQPFPDVIENAKSVAVGAAAWESIRSGQAVTVCNEF